MGHASGGVCGVLCVFADGNGERDDGHGVHGRIAEGGSAGQLTHCCVVCCCVNFGSWFCVCCC